MPGKNNRFRTIADFHRVRFTAKEREDILRAIKRNAHDPDAEQFLRRSELAASYFLSHNAPSNKKTLPVEHKFRTETPAVVRERLKNLRDAIREARKRVSLLDAAGRRLLTKEVRNSAVGAMLFNTDNPLNVALLDSDEAAVYQERTFTVEGEEIRTELLETLVEQALAEASRTKHHEGRSRNTPLEILAFEISDGLGKLGIRSTTASNGAFGTVLQTIHDAAYRTAEGHKKAERALAQDELDKQDVRWSEVRLPKEAPCDPNQLKRLLSAIRKQ